MPRMRDPDSGSLPLLQFPDDRLGQGVVVAPEVVGPWQGDLYLTLTNE